MNKALIDNFGGGNKVKPRISGKLVPIRDRVVVEEMKFGMQTTSKGLIIPSDDGADHGIKPRWGRVYAVGPEQTDIKPGQYILVDHGRWTRGVELEDPESGKSTTVRMVDTNDILAVSDEPQEDITIGSKTGAV